MWTLPQRFSRLRVESRPVAAMSQRTSAHRVRVDSPACLLPTPPVLSEERAMPDEKPQEAKVTDRLFATYVSSDRKVLDIDGFKAALVKALGDAYEQGLQDGLVTRTTGPDA